MPVKIRLTRMGKKKQPTYRVVVVDSRKPRDGAYIEQIGRYDPRREPSLVEIDNDRALVWLENGAQPTDRARKLLEISGAWQRFRVAKGDIHMIEAAPEPPKPAAEPVTAAVEPEIHVVGGAEEEPDAEPVTAAVEPEIHVVGGAEEEPDAEPDAASDVGGHPEAAGVGEPVDETEEQA